MAVVERALSAGNPYTSTIKRGTRVLFRPLVPEDAVDLHGDLVRLSSGLMGLQLFPDAPRSQDHDLDYLTAVDFDKHGAWVALALGGSSDHAVGIGRWKRVADESDSAVAAVVVDDDWRYERLGGSLLALVVQSATDRGIPLLHIPLWVSASVLRAPLERLGARFGQYEGGRMDVDLMLPANGDALRDLRSRVGLQEIPPDNKLKG